MCILYERIEIELKKRNWHDADLYRAMELKNRSFLSDLAKGRKDSISSSALMQIASILNVTSDYLLGIEKTPTVTDERYKLDISVLSEDNQRAILNYYQFLIEGQKRDVPNREVTAV